MVAPRKAAGQCGTRGSFTDGEVMEERVWRVGGNGEDPSTEFGASTPTAPIQQQGGQEGRSMLRQTGSASNVRDVEGSNSEAGRLLAPGSSKGKGKRNAETEGDMRSCGEEG